MRLIDAEAFEKSVRTDFWEHYTDCHDTDQTDLLELIMDNLAEQPTIEAKPVVHAHWEPKKIMARTPFARNFYCSNCKDEPLECKHICGNCGAQMDEEENDNG